MRVVEFGDCVLVNVVLDSVQKELWACSDDLKTQVQFTYYSDWASGLNGRDLGLKIPSKPSEEQQLSN